MKNYAAFTLLSRTSELKLPYKELVEIAWCLVAIPAFKLGVHVVEVAN